MIGSRNSGAAASAASRKPIIAAERNATSSEISGSTSVAERHVTARSVIG